MIEDASYGNGNTVLDTENHQNLVIDEVCISRYRVLRDATKVPDVIFASIVWKMVLSLTHTVVLNYVFEVLVPHLDGNGYWKCAAKLQKRSNTFRSHLNGKDH